MMRVSNKRPTAWGYRRPLKKTKIEDVRPPSFFVQSIFKEHGFSQDDITARAMQKFLKPTPEVTKYYTMEVTKAVRGNDIDKLRELHASGAVLDCCNKFGDSLVHIACRRGHTEIVRFLVEEVKVSVHFLDDLERNALHDACWTSEPNFEIVETLLRASPELSLCVDKRGHAPFDYVRQAHWNEWNRFLFERQTLLFPTKIQ
jgi:ankyrin repeat protein